MLNFRPAKRCCFCITNLKDACLIIGWLTLIGGVLHMFFLVRELTHLGDVDTAVLDFNLECDKACMQTAHRTALGVGIFSLVMDIIIIIVSVLFIRGINKDRPTLMGPYIAYVIIEIAFLLFAFVAMLILVGAIPEIAAIISAIMIPILAIAAHFLHVVLTYQRQVRQTLGEQPIHLEEDLTKYSVSKETV